MLSRRFRLYFSTLDSPHAGPGADDGSRTITLLLTHIMDRTGQIYEEAWRRVVIGGDMKGEVSSGEELLGPAEFRVQVLLATFTFLAQLPNLIFDLHSSGQRISTMAKTFQYHSVTWKLERNRFMVFAHHRTWHSFACRGV